MSLYEGERPIVQWFVIRRVPEGSAPLEIREQWVGVPLPLRHLRNMDAPRPSIVSEVVGDKQMFVIPDSTSVSMRNCIKALMLFERIEAAQWWDENRRQTLSPALAFVATEGQYMSPEQLEAVLPGVNNFDQLD